MNATLKTDTQKIEYNKLHGKPPRFTNRCSDWPMCMCQKQCENADKANTQYQLGLA